MKRLMRDLFSPGLLTPVTSKRNKNQNSYTHFIQEFMVPSSLTGTNPSTPSFLEANQRLFNLCSVQSFS